MSDIIQKIAMIVGIIVLIAIIVAFPLMWLWNWLMPTIFGLTTINFWQALGLNMLGSFLFGGASSKKI